MARIANWRSLISEPANRQQSRFSDNTHPSFEKQVHFLQEKVKKKVVCDIGSIDQGDNHG
jgi:hypothetical protein